ncbi:MAG: TIM barrel protein [Coriobacteriia bacterium]|nr:TIM barrel protein [Coriobacteriia bacterium]
MFNFSTSSDDVQRYADAQDFRSMAEGFDGVELMVFEPDERGVVPKDLVVGIHSAMPFMWADFWRNDRAALVREFGSMDKCHRFFGGSDPQVIADGVRRGFAAAHEYGAEYVVVHATDVLMEEMFTFDFARSDEYVIDALCEMLNEALVGEDGSVALLLENLWQPGFSFTRPEMTRRLLEGVGYGNTGIMLDTGHMLHTDLTLRTQEQGLAYVNRMLDEHGGLCQHVRGVHLNQSLTGEYCQQVMASFQGLPEADDQRWGRVFEHAFALDRHEPFTCKGVAQMLARLPLEYLTFEFISQDRQQHQGLLRQQWQALEADGFQRARTAHRGCSA